MSNTIDLARLTQLAALFKDLSNGKHLNRLSDAATWVELEREQQAYSELFAALGYELRVDGRGFAWFHTEDANSNVNKATRQLALLFMVVFDTQAQEGKPLLRFSDWLIDRSLLAKVHEQHQELLNAEGLDVEGLAALFDTASRYGFAASERNQWRLLPAACRYLDHFEALAAASRERDNPLTDDESSDVIDDDDAEGDSL